MQTDIHQNMRRRLSAGSNRKEKSTAFPILIQFILISMALFVFAFLSKSSEEGESSSPVYISAVSANKSIINRSWNHSRNTINERLRIVLFVEKHHLKLFSNWMHYFKRSNDYSWDLLELICMDHETLWSKKSHLIKCSNRSFALSNETGMLDRVGEIWVRRTEKILDLLSEGFDVLVSDFDALWIDDPLPIISKFAYGSLETISSFLGPQIISSRGWYPSTLFAKWGSCLCMGFIFFKASPFTIDLMSHVRSHISTRYYEVIALGDRDQVLTNLTSPAIRPDDQLAVNAQLYEWNISWSNPFMTLAGNHVPDFGTVERNGSNYSVILLPHSQFVRQCHSETEVRDWRSTRLRTQRAVKKALSQAVVAHCRVAGFEKEKKEYFSVAKLWKFTRNPS